jgi:hypothetical protein
MKSHVTPQMFNAGGVASSYPSSAYLYARKSCCCFAAMVTARYIYARFYVIPIGHYTWFVVTCNELTAPGLFW